MLFGGKQMSAKWEKKGTNDGVLTFSIEQAVIEKGLTQAFNKVKKNLNVPGFLKEKYHVLFLTVCMEKKRYTKMR